MGTSTATCLPSCTALNAARMATSVLPKPTSPQTRRSIGRVGLHVGLHVVDGLQLVGRLLVREGLLQLVLPRRVGRERVARRVCTRFWYSTTSSWAISAHRGARPAPWPSAEVAAAEAVQRGRLAAGVVAHRVDLVGRDVELVVALVLEQQVVALDAADGPLDHAAVAADAVLVVHDVVAGLQVVEERRPRRGAAGAGRRWARRRPVRSASASTASLTRGQDEARARAARPRSWPPARVRSASPSRSTARSRPARAAASCSRPPEPSPSAATTTR